MGALAEHPLTFGQLSVWRINETYPLERWSETYLRTTFPVPAGNTLDQVIAAVTHLCERHESLRTHFVDTPAGPIQRVMPAVDPVTVELVERPGATEADAVALSIELARDRIDPATEFGRRFGVVTDAGRPAYLALVVDHIVTDGTGLYRLQAELTAALGGQHPGGEAWLAEHPPKPRDLAVEQRSESGRRRREAALAYWRNLLDSLPPEIFPVPESAGQTPGRIEAILHSTAARANLETLSASVGVSTQSTLLALTALATATLTGRTDVVLTLQVSNRYTRRWEGLVSSMNQYSPIALRVADGSSFAEFAASVHIAGLNAYRMGFYDMDAVTEMVRRRRGIALGFDHFFNFLARDVTARPAPAPDEHIPGRVEETHPFRQIGPRLDVKVRSGAEMPIVVRMDPLWLPRAGLRGLMSWFDEQLFCLAAGTDRTVADILARCGKAVG